MQTTEFKQRTLITEQVTYILWESAGRKIIEAQLTPDQISQLFTDVEQGATAAGGNRTAVGKGKDAAGAVNKAWTELKSKIQDSAPIKNIDAMYDQAAEKLKQATGGDEGIDKYVQKYRAFAKKHPMAQSFIYAALIGAAGISGAGAGGAAALGLFKLTDKLLQGEKFSSAAYSGAKTGVAAYGASKLADYVKGKIGGDASAPDTTAGDTATADTGTRAQTGTSSDTTAGTQNAPTVPTVSFAGGGGVDYNLADLKRAAVAAAKESGKEAQSVTDAIVDAMTKQAERAGTAPSFQVADEIRLYVDSGITLGKGPFAVLKNLKVAAGESIDFKPIQIETIIEWCDATPAVVLTEGPLDAIKKAGSAIANKAKTVGKNITTKVTADKLNKAWAKAGKPTDSDAIANILRQQGVSDQVLAPVYKQLGAKLPAAAPKAAPAAPGAKPAAAPAMDFKTIQQSVAKLSPADAKELVTHIDSLNKTTPAAAPKAVPGAKAAAAPKAGNLNTYFQNFSKEMQGAGDKNQKIALAKELVNTVADRGGEDSATAVSILRKVGGDLDNNFKQAAMNALKNGQRLLKQSVYFEISKMLRENNLSWSDLGIRVHLLEGTNKLFAISFK